MMIFIVKEVCQSCNGTGLYIGMGERDGAAVQCFKCNGSGCHEFKHEYVEFTKRNPTPKTVKRVYLCNPGICIGTGNGHSLEDFGGMTVADWLAGKKSPQGIEDRQHTCPCWFYQSCDYSKKPDWPECKENWGGSFSGCKHFKTKEKCWEKFDKTVKSG